MQLTQESRRARWLGLGSIWIVVAILLCLHAVAVRHNIAQLDGVGLRGAKEAPTPMHRIVPTLFADATMWVRNALDLAGGAGPQMRYTHVDNAPFGREVHWHSGLAWLITISGTVRHWITGEPLPTAIENVLPWFNTPLLFGFVVLLSGWVARRAGLGAALFLAIGMLGHDLFYDGFSPHYVDHHGILSASVLGLILGAMFMGLGLWRASDQAAQLLPSSREAARRAAVFSAVCGAVGMWVSAATLIPAIIITGAAGVIALLLHAPRADAGGIHLDASLWRWWGRVGGGACLGFYLLEYFPTHLGLRLEVNHPLYAFSWWGGSEIIAQFAEWRCAARGKFRPRWRALALAVVPMFVAVLVILIGGERVFVVFDPFITRLSRHVSEGISLPTALRLMGWQPFIGEFIWIAASFFVGVIAWWRARPADRVVVAFGFVAVSAFTAMALTQLRWGSSASGPQICGVLLGLALLTARASGVVRWSVVAGAAILMSAFPIMRIVKLNAATKSHIVDRSNAMQPIYRDIAATLRASQPDGKIVLLASPNGSVAMGYYGEFRTIGTLYWENLAGTKAAAEMFSAPTDDAARHLVRSRGVTHVAAVSEDNFIAEYYNLLHPDAGADEVKGCFGYRLLIDQNVPLWLDPIPYNAPSDVPLRPDRILLYRTQFASPAAEDLFEAALAEFKAGHLEATAAKLDAAIQAAPESAEFWAAKANLRLIQNDPQGAFDAVRSALSHASPARQVIICKAEAGLFYERHLHGAAVQMYRAVLSLTPDNQTANNLAWLLATTPDDKLRNGAEALALTEKLLAQGRAVPYLNADAAALAEVGRYDDAVKIQTEVLELVRPQADPKTVQLAEARLARYRSQQPWRQ